MAENVIEGPISCDADGDALAARRAGVGVGDQHRLASVGRSERVDAGRDDRSTAPAPGLAATCFSGSAVLRRRRPGRRRRCVGLVDGVGVGRRGGHGRRFAELGLDAAGGGVNAEEQRAERLAGDARHLGLAGHLLGARADRDGKVVLPVERLGGGLDVEGDFLREAEIDRRSACRRADQHARAEYEHGGNSVWGKGAARAADDLGAAAFSPPWVRETRTL